MMLRSLWVRCASVLGSCGVDIFDVMKVIDNEWTSVESRHSHGRRTVRRIGKESRIAVIIVNVGGTVLCIVQRVKDMQDAPPEIASGLTTTRNRRYVANSTRSGEMRWT